MKVLSWDIGFHHISYALFSYDHNHLHQPILETEIPSFSSHLSLLDWNVWSINDKLCPFTDSISNKKCCNVSKWFLSQDLLYDPSNPNQSSFFCKKHSPKESNTPLYSLPEDIYIPCNSAFRGSICHEKAILSNQEYHPEECTPIFIHQACEQHAKKWTNMDWMKENKKDNPQDWITWGKQMFSYLEQHTSLWIDIDHVLIENQPSLKNPTMKTYQAMLSSFFLMKSMQSNHPIQIHLLSASNKNKIPSPPSSIDILHIQQKKKEKTSYKENKQQSIQCCIEWLTYLNMDSWKTYIQQLSKQDDVADSFLQGLYYLLTVGYSSFSTTSTKTTKKTKKQSKETISLPI
jgi:hypothetical protein